MRLAAAAARTVRMAARMLQPAGAAAAAATRHTSPRLPSLLAAQPAARRTACSTGTTQRLGAALRSSSVLAQRLQRAALSVASQAQPADAGLHEASSSSDEDDQQLHPDDPTKEYVVVNFYHLVDIQRPHEVISHHKAWMEGKDVRGRIYISEQGINAQYGGVREDAEGYAKWLKETQPLFKGLFYTVWPAEGHQYPKLRLKYRPNLISLAGGMQELPITSPEARAKPTPPSEWKRMLDEGRRSGKMPLVLDVRNSYEWDAGHFVGAERPLEENFNQTPTEALPEEVPQYLKDADPEQPVMMYCTGGIRCDVYSSYLKKKGFKNLYTLEGGIQNYMREEGLDHWNGSLFVFDGRMAIRLNKDKEEELQAAAPCQVCGGQAVLPHLNCANIDCNKLFIACDGCKAQLKGCCCEACIDAPRLLRPAKTQGQYGNWSQYVHGEEDAEEQQAMVAGRGEGRISRRRRRQQALKDREQAKRAVKVERRRQAKEIMASLQQQVAAAAAAGADAADGGAAASADRAERLQRLRQLRERLASAAAASA